MSMVFHQHNRFQAAANNPNKHLSKCQTSAEQVREDGITLLENEIFFLSAKLQKRMRHRGRDETAVMLERRLNLTFAALTSLTDADREPIFPIICAQPILPISCTSHHTGPVEDSFEVLGAEDPALAAGLSLRITLPANEACGTMSTEQSSSPSYPGSPTSPSSFPGSSASSSVHMTLPAATSACSPMTLSQSSSYPLSPKRPAAAATRSAMHSVTAAEQILHLHDQLWFGAPPARPSPVLAAQKHSSTVSPVPQVRRRSSGWFSGLRGFLR